MFDTIVVRVKTGAKEVIARAESQGINLRLLDNHSIGISLDEASSMDEIAKILSAIHGKDAGVHLNEISAGITSNIPTPFARTSKYLTHPVFNTHHSETEMLRYLHRRGGAVAGPVHDADIARIEGELGGQGNGEDVVG